MKKYNAYLHTLKPRGKSTVDGHPIYTKEQKQKAMKYSECATLLKKSTVSRKTGTTKKSGYPKTTRTMVAPGVYKVGYKATYDAPITYGIEVTKSGSKKTPIKEESTKASRALNKAKRRLKLYNKELKKLTPEDVGKSGKKIYSTAQKKAAMATALVKYPKKGTGPSKSQKVGAQIKSDLEKAIEQSQLMNINAAASDSDYNKSLSILRGTPQI